jgi:molybdopterin-binding protein
VNKKKISARNQLAGRVAEVRKGQTTAHVKADIGNGVIGPGLLHKRPEKHAGITAGFQARLSDKLLALAPTSLILLAITLETRREARGRRIGV